MPASIAITPASGIVAKSTVCRITADDVPSNDVQEFDPNIYPTAPVVNYFYKAELAGQDPLVSPVFSTNSEGFAEWNGLIFPAAGTWDLNLVDADSGSVVTDLAVSVS